MKTAVRKRILTPKYLGSLSPKEGMRLCVHEEIEPVKKARLRFFLLVDLSDGIIADSSFRVYGPPFLILAADAAAELILRKTYTQAMKIPADRIEEKTVLFPPKEMRWINFTLATIEGALTQCGDLIKDTPIESAPNIEENYIEEFPLLSKSEKIALIESVIDDEIRPYIEMDAGGVTIQDLKENTLEIVYEGACTSCYAATGSTLSAIQNILQTKVHPDILVEPVGLASGSNP